MKYSALKTNKVIGKFKIETPEKVWIFEIISLKSIVYSFNCGDHIKRKLKDFSKYQTKNSNFEEYKKMFKWRGISKRM